jgi:hypothetical protein
MGEGAYLMAMWESEYFGSEEEKSDMAGGKPKWNVATPRKYGRDGEKTFWVNVGSAWENDGDKGKHDVTITLDALPLPDADGQVRLFLFPKDDDGGGERRGSSERSSKRESSRSRSSSRADDDEIPF